jgi:hypothetical protein
MSGARRRALALASLVAFASACGSAGPRLAAPGRFDRALREAEQGAPAVVLHEERSFGLSFVHGTPVTTVREFRRVLIADHRGLDFATVAVDYGPNERIASIEARTLLPNGSVVPVAAGSIADVEVMRLGGSGGVAYRRRILNFPQVQTGAVLEHLVAREVVSWLPSDSFRPTLEVPVRSARYTVDLPEELTVTARKRGFEGPEVTPGDRGGPFSLRRSTWRASSLAPPADVPLRPPVVEFAPYVSFSLRSYDRDLKDLFRTWSAAIEPRTQRIEEAAALLRALPAEIPTSGDVATRVDAIWNHVQSRIEDRTRLTSNELEIPDAERILATRFGSADERGFVLFALCKRSGLEATLIFAPPLGDAPIAEDFPDPAQAWRLDILVQVEGPERQRIVLDPSCLGCAAGELAPHHVGPALQVEQVSGDALARFERLTPPAGAADRVELAAEVELSPRGLVVTRGVFRALGNTAAQIRYERSRARAVTPDFERAVRKRYLDGIEEGRIGFRGLEDLRSALEIELENVVLARSGFVDGDAIAIVPIAALWPARWMDALGAERAFGVEFPDAPDFELETRLRLPDAGRVALLPAAQELTSQAGRYAVSVAQAGRCVVVREHFSLPGRRVSLEAYPEFVRFIERVRELRSRGIAIRSGRAG